MAQKIHIEPVKIESRETRSADQHFLMLYNDDFNTFEFVITSLMEVCDHTAEQAEQCATITHFKGKCDIKKGLKKDLQPMQIALIKRNLKAIIE